MEGKCLRRKSISKIFHHLFEYYYIACYIEAIYQEKGGAHVVLSPLSK